MTAQPKIAVLALQGDFDKHIQVLTRLGVDAIPARMPSDIHNADAIILPGGESTTISKLMARYGVDEAIKEAHSLGKPIYGTCAGLILLAHTIAEGTQERGGQSTLGLLDATVVRNAFGRQVDSFEAKLDVPVLGSDPVHAVFIRAPYLSEIGPNVQTLATFDGKAVFVQQETLLGSAFHPELADDDRVHRYFLSLIAGNP